jgi:5-methylcytosine-specific restriction protein B
MTDAKSNRFTKYFPLLLDALRSVYPTPMRPAEARAWIRSKIEVPAEDLTRFIENSTQSIFENDVHWARFYLTKANLVSSPKRGLWGLTPEGFNTKLNPEETWALYVQVRDARGPGVSKDEEKVPAPGTTDEGEDVVVYWFAGAVWNRVEDQTPRFLAEGIWENGYDDQFFELVRKIKPGDRIAIKASFVQKHRLPFNVGGKPVSAMRIKARVAWDPHFEPRDWYFYTYRTTLVEADIEREDARRLVDFTFRGAPQDYSWFLAQPYWVEEYGARADTVGKVTASSEIEEDEILEPDDEPAYTVKDIVADGSFLLSDELQSILDRWRSKKNLILQGPPGTGKTWLAKRLGFALVGSKDREPLARGFAWSSFILL